MEKPLPVAQHGSSILNSIYSKYYLNNIVNLSLVSYLYIFIRSLIDREDMYAQDSIDLLQNSGLQFREHEEHGIEPIEFAELLMSSGKLIVTIKNNHYLAD